MDERQEQKANVEENMEEMKQDGEKAGKAKKEKKKREKKKGFLNLYTPSGIRNRKILCMLMFCGFMAGFYFSFFTVEHYGTIIYRQQDYFSSVAYEGNLYNDVSRLLQHTIYKIDQEDIAEKFSIYDVANGRIITYRTDVMEDSTFFQEGWDFFNLYQLEDWVIDEKSVSFDMSSLRSAKAFLKSDYAKNCYLYFSGEAFRALFEEKGIVNENQRLTTAMSEEARIIYFDEEGSMAKRGYQIGKSDPSEIFKYNTEDIPYAAYDPVQYLYYSTWDDYFAPYSSYIYDCEALRDYMEGNPDLEKKTDSFVIPLLSAYNMDSVYLGESISRRRELYNQAEDYFARVATSGFLYYLEADGKVYSNVDLEDLAKQSNPYIIEPASSKKMSGKMEAFEKQYGYSLQPYDAPELSEFFDEAFPADSVLYFGVSLEAPDAQTADEGSAAREFFNWFKAYTHIWPATIAAAVCFVFLLMLAISLLITTGRREKGDKEVILYKFDRLPLELWVLIAGGVTTGLAVLDMAIGILPYSSETNSLLTMALPFGICCIPFGIAFMEFSLSLARRIKAKNLFQNLLIVRPFKKGRKGLLGQTKWGALVLRAKDRLAGWYRASRCKLIILLGIFMILQIPIIMLLVEYNGDQELFVCGVLLEAGLILLTGIRLYKIENDIVILSNTVKEITKGNLDEKCRIGNAFYLFQDLEEGINHIGDGLKAAVETSLKDERMKTELITNVSHDLKTPLTSIINYIDLLKKEEMPNDEAKHYIEVLEAKAGRLKQLTENLVEAAKATSGNIELEMMPLTFDELMKQALGEFEDKFQKRNLTLVAAYPKEPAVILADGRQLYRVIENVLQNAYKYAMEGSRIYAELSGDQNMITFILKNVSAAPLNISPEELMERFTRGDSSRTTEGSGLGLAIARDLTKLMDGTFDILLDGDLFKVIIVFPQYHENNENFLKS